MKLSNRFILHMLLLLCANMVLRAQNTQVTVVKTVTTTGQPTVKTYTNLSGQTVRESQQRFDGQYLNTDYVHDTYGRLKKVSVPHRGAVISEWEEYKYDNYDRTTKVRDASGKKEVSVYNPLSVTKTTDNITRTTTVDVTGKTVSIEDAAGTIAYEYRADGQLDFVVAPGEDVGSNPIITSFEYDQYGRQNKIVDPSAGVKTFVWSGADSIYTETDARGKVIKTIYDKYNRIRKTEAVGESTTIYTYNADGLLADATTKNTENTLLHAKAFTYDTYMRPYTEKETVIDAKWLQKTYSYANGAVITVAYSSNKGNIVTQNYVYANGYNTELKLDNTTSVWKLTAENDMGLATGTTTGKLTRTYDYNAAGILTGRTIKNGSASIQNVSYGFDTPTGNLSWRKDNTHNLTENFGYDNLNRLTDFGGKKMMTYDQKGNITDYAGIGKFDYTKDFKPYQISLVTPYGTQVSEKVQIIDYNPQMRPVSITENNYKATFTYTGEGDRVKMQLNNETINQLLRYYVSGEYETESGVAGDKERLYLGGDAYSATAAYIKEGTGAWNVYYIGRDHLGSITHVIDANGAVKEELSYDPWGRLRNPANHELYAADVQASLLLGGRGYTGHEHLAMFGLINMNARLYDPVLGRFLSPDPYVQAPDWSQNFNRYSYALNNPLRYNDPSGEFIPILAAALIGAYINSSLQMLSGNVNSMGDLFKSLGVGAAAGAAGAATGGIISGVGFVAGATSGAISGFSSGMVLGAGNAWASGADFGQGLGAGLKSGLLGAGTGVLLGGTISGIEAARNGGNFFTGKGYTQISELAASADDLDLGGDAASNRANLKTIQKELKWNNGKYGVNNMNIEGNVPVENSKYYYLRNSTNGFIEKAPLSGGTPISIRGLAVKSSSGIFKTGTDMYLSFHKSLTGLKITVNHELIHAYHASLGLRYNNNYSEYSATSNTALYMPQYNMDLLQMSNYSSAFGLGYGWPKYLLPIK